MPRLLAFSDDRVAAFEDLGVRAAAIAAAGPSVALVARLPLGSTDALASLAQRFVALAAPPMAAVLVTARMDVARAVGAHGVILRNDDLRVREVRSLDSTPSGRSPSTSSGQDAQDAKWVFRSVHTESEAEAAARDGADAIVVGTIWPTATHPSQPPAGTALLERVVSFGVPTYAIGGVTPGRVAEAKAAGAWGVAAIAALWDAAAPYRVAMEMMKPWMEMG
jgi:thiamine-phosphate diphosphorylase